MQALMFERSGAPSLGQPLRAALALRGVHLDQVRAWGPFDVALAAAEPLCAVLEEGSGDGLFEQRFDTLVRERQELPLIVIVAGYTGAERIAWLNRGAEDAVSPEIEIDELAARVAAAARRAHARRQPRRLSHGPLVLHPERRGVSWHGAEVALTAKEFALLECLVRGARRTHSRDELHAALEAGNLDRASNALDVHVHALRRKLHARVVRTVRGVGYRIGETGDLEH